MDVYFLIILGGWPCHHDKSLSHNLHANIDSWNLGAVLLARLDFTHSQLSGSCGRVSGFGANGSQVGGAIFVAAYTEPIYLNLICSRNVCLILKKFNRSLHSANSMSKKVKLFCCTWLAFPDA